MNEADVKDPARRKFLHAVPVAAAAGFVFTEASLFSASAAARGTAAGGATWQKFGAEELQDDTKALAGSPGNKNLVDDKTFTMVMTAETAKKAAEFEWHEERDHIFQILDGSTVYELGGTPKNARNTRPGEWLAPESEGAVSLTLHKGDMLVIPRGTPHKRSTEGTVTLLLISPQGTVSA